MKCSKCGNIWSMRISKRKGHHQIIYDGYCGCGDKLQRLHKQIPYGDEDKFVSKSHLDGLFR